MDCGVTTSRRVAQGNAWNATFQSVSKIPWKYFATLACAIHSPASRFLVTAESDQFCELTKTRLPSTTIILL